jgi:Glyoxalase/Bleomycin resistance protein/Dioxygenase superfamily
VTRAAIAPGFCQVAWVVKDIAAAEKFFIETMGIDRFMRMENLAAKDTEGTYLGKPGNWVCHLYLAYAGDTQIELIQPVSGESMFQESLDRHGDAVQHVAYFLDDSAYAAAAAHLESSGFPRFRASGCRSRGWATSTRARPSASSPRSLESRKADSSSCAT